MATLTSRILTYANEYGLFLNEKALQSTRYHTFLTRIDSFASALEMEYIVPLAARKIASFENELRLPFIFQQNHLAILGEALASPLIENLKLEYRSEDRCIHNFVSGAILTDVNETLAEMILARALRLCLSKYGKYFSLKVHGVFKKKMEDLVFGDLSIFLFT